MYLEKLWTAFGALGEVLEHVEHISHVSKFGQLVNLLHLYWVLFSYVLCSALQVDVSQDSMGAASYHV